jgi:hypothetical protein
MPAGMKWCDLIDDVIGVILEFLEEFYRADATQRLGEFMGRYSANWGAVMESVRTNTPVYSLEFRFGRITVRSPDCCPSAFLSVLMPVRKIYRHVR